MKLYWHELTLHQREKMLTACEKGTVKAIIANYSVYRMSLWGLLTVERVSKHNRWYEPTELGCELVVSYLCRRLNVKEIEDIERAIKYYHEEAWRNIMTGWSVEKLGAYVELNLKVLP